MNDWFLLTPNVAWSGELPAVDKTRKQGSFVGCSAAKRDGAQASRDGPASS